MSSIARTATRTRRSIAFTSSDVAAASPAPQAAVTAAGRSAQRPVPTASTNVLPSRIAVKIAAVAPETLKSSFIAPTNVAGRSSAPTASISSRVGCSPIAAAARSMKFVTRSYAAAASVSV